MERKLIFLFITILMLFSACSQSTTTAEMAADFSHTVELNAAKKVKGQEKCDFVKRYALPMPLDILQGNKLSEPDLTLLLSPDSSLKYQNLVELSFVYGVYLADLAYCLAFEQEQYFLNYFDVVLDISGQLGIDNVITRKYLERLTENFNSDSAKYLVEHALSESCSYLENSGQMNVLPNVINGAWVESVYLLTGTMLANEDYNLALYDIVMQQNTVADSLQSMIEYSMMGIESFKVNEKLQQFSSMLEQLQQLYNDLTVGNQTSIEDQLQALFEYFARMRKSFI